MRLRDVLAACRRCRHRHEPEKRFAFTLNNPTREEISHLIKMMKKFARYGVAQLEQAASGTIHVQGYVEFKLAMDECRARQVLETPRLYAKPARANRESNKRYCTKTDSRMDGPWTIDNRRGHAARVSAARAAAGRASGAKRRSEARKRRRARENESTPIQDDMERWFVSQGLCPHCGEPPRCCYKSGGKAWRRYVE